MKKFFLLSTVLLSAYLVKAQNYETIKNMVILNQAKKAKEEVDKGMSNSKFNSKPEAFILKATVYSALAEEAGTKGTPAGDQLLADAEAAFNKYKEMDPQMSLLSDPIYQNAPIHIYSGLFSAGYKDYEAKNWQAGYDKFKKVVDYSDLLIDKKIITVTADTNSVLLAGITAESAGKKDEAAKYYGRIAEMRAGGQGFEGIYSYLVRYYATKKDMENFEKYKAIGLELYPESDFFKLDKIDFAVGLEEDFNKKIKALEDMIASDPKNAKAPELLGEIIYDTLNSRKDDAVQPANAAELETKMIKAFNKAAELKPGDEMPYLYIGDHFINKSIKADEEKRAFAQDLAKRTKPGVAASKEDVAKRDALDAKYIAAMESAREPYEKAAEIFAKKSELTAQDKQQYRKVTGYLRRYLYR